MGMVDVIIPVYNPDEKLKETLMMLACQTVSVGRIILVETVNDSFNLQVYLEKIDHLDVMIEIIKISRDEFDHGDSRNKGIYQSESEFFICMTQDAVPFDNNMVEILLEPFRGEKVGATYARQLVNDNCKLQERITREFNYPEKDRIQTVTTQDKYGIKTYFCSNVCAAYRRQYFDDIGGFDKGIILNEDMIYASKLIDNGYDIVYCSNAKVVHSHNYTCMQQFRRNFDIGVSQRMHSYIFNRFSSSSEGIKLVKATEARLKKEKAYRDIFMLYVVSGYKFLGYKLGKSYMRIPRGICKWASMNKGFWNMR